MGHDKEIEDLLLEIQRRNWQSERDQKEKDQVISALQDIEKLKSRAEEDASLQEIQRMERQRDMNLYEEKHIKNHLDNHTYQKYGPTMAGQQYYPTNVHPNQLYPSKVQG